MNATVTALTSRTTTLAEALAELSFKDGSAIVALSLPQSRVVAYASMGRKIPNVMHSAAEACFRLGLVDHGITAPGVYTLTTKGAALVKKAAKAVKVADAGITVEVAPAAKVKVAKAEKATQAKHFSHTDCAHERTPAARAACRKAHAKA